MLRDVMRLYEDGLTSDDLRDIVLNYSRTEVGLRARQGPVGFMVRDQGQVDQYAGRARNILTVDGYVLTMGNAVATVADWITLAPREVRTLVLAGRTIDPDVHKGTPMARLLRDVPNDVFFCDASGNAALPVQSLLTSQTIFRPAEYDGAVSSDVEAFNLSDAAMGI